MSRRSTSPIWVAAGIVLGAACGPAAEAWRPIPAAIAIAAAGLAWRGLGGLALAGYGLGLTAAWAWPSAKPLPPGLPSAERPVTVVAAPLGPWRPSDRGWRLEARAQVVRQGSEVHRWGERVLVTLYAGPQPPIGRRLRVTGYLDRSSGLANGGPARAGPWRLRTNSVRFVRAHDGKGAWRGSSALSRPRARIEEALRGHSGGGVALVRALALGERRALGRLGERALRRAGLAHLLAVSGLHVGVLAAIVHRSLGWAPPWLRLLAPLSAATTYLLLVGPRPAIVRASLMALIAGAGMAAERPGGAGRALALACGAMVMARPELVSDLAFQLSASATGGVIWSGSVLVPRWASRLGPLARVAAATVGAQLWSAPWAVPAFHLVTPFSVVWNLLAAPWIVVSLAAALGVAAVAQIAPALAGGLLPVMDALALPIDGLALLPPGALFGRPVAATALSATLVAAALAAALVWPRTVLPALLGAFALAHYLLAGPQGAEIVLLDVGQGEAIVVRDGAAAVLVDGGGWRGGDIGGRVLVPALARIGIFRLRAVALSHPDADHCLGLADLVGYLPVAEVWTAPGWDPGSCAGQLETATGSRLRPLWRGERAAVGRWRFTALHPPPGHRGGGNDRSLVLLAELGGRRALLTGDLEAAGERRLAAHLVDILAGSGGARPGDLRPVDLLKLAHHGSRTSTTPALLDVVRPRLAVVSAGRGNLYGHPASQVLERLRRRGIPIWSTDRHGRLRVRFDPDRPLEVRVASPAP